jgi:hypothetical protein
MTTGIDFALKLGGVVSGTVSNAANGEPISQAVVSLYDQITDGIEIELGTGIFNDGFESGDTARWSTSIN